MLRAVDGMVAWLTTESRHCGALVVSECYSDLVLRIPWYVAWPILISILFLAHQFVAARSLYFPAA